jgi:ornithine carbamoyltransferase
MGDPPYRRLVQQTGGGELSGIDWKRYAQFQGRDFLTLADFTKEELLALLDLAAQLKKMRQEGQPIQFLPGKSLAMIFEKSSTRTRVSFETGMFYLGGTALFLSKQDIQIGRGETIADTARVLSRYVDGIMIRTFSHENVVEMARYATVPVINGLTDSYHPCQVMADLLTIQEKKGQLSGLKMAYVGDGNNMVHSLLQAAGILGIHMDVAAPPGYEPEASVVDFAKSHAAENGVTIRVINDPAEAVKDADVVITDVWASMGQEEEQQQRMIDFAGYQVNGALVEKADKDFIFLHCLPAHRGEEVAEEVIDGEHSVVFDEAENRLHAQNAILAVTMRG